MRLKSSGNIFINFLEDTYKCNMEQIEENSFCISILDEEKLNISLKHGEKFIFNYYEDRGHYFNFVAKLSSVKNQEGIKKYMFDSISNIEKIQRRNHVRVNLKEYLLYKKIDEEGDEWKIALLIDLSGGGVRIKIKENLALEEKIYIKMCYNNVVDTVCGKIVRSFKGNGDNIYGVEFLDISERKRDKIVEKVFKMLRKERELV